MPDVYKTTDNQNFSVPGASPSQINQLIWQGLPGKYIAAADDGLYTTIDGGVTWGKLYPNTEFATTLPGGAVPRQLAFSVGPNGGGNCEVIGQTCQVFPLSFAAMNNTGGAPDPSPLDVQSVINNVSGIQTVLDGLRTEDFNECYWIASIENGTVVLNYNGDGVPKTIIMAVASRTAVGYPVIPTPVCIEVTNWKLIDTKVFGDNSRLSVFTGVFSDIPPVPSHILSLDFGTQTQEAYTASIRIFPNGNLINNIVVTSKTIAGIPQGDTTFLAAVDYGTPYTADNHTWIIDDVDSGAGEGDEAGAAVIALEVQFCPLGVASTITQSSNEDDDQLVSSFTDFFGTASGQHQTFFIAVTSRQNSGIPAVPTITSVLDDGFSTPDNIDWVVVESVLFGPGTGNRLTMWRGQSTPEVENFPTVEYTINFGAVQQGYCAVTYNMSFPEGNPVRQTYSDGEESAANISVLFPDTVLSTSLLFLVAASWDNVAGDSSALIPPWTLDYFRNSSGPDNDFYQNLVVPDVHYTVPDFPDPPVFEFAAPFGPFAIAVIGVELYGA